MKAVAMMQLTRAYSASKRANDKIVLNIGISYGACWLLRGADIFGSVSNEAFHLGENISNNEILITPVAKERVGATDKRGDQFAFEKHSTANAYIATSKLEPADLAIPRDKDLIPVLTPPINGEEPPAFVNMVATRIRQPTRELKSAVDFKMKVLGRCSPPHDALLTPRVSLPLCCLMRQPMPQR